MSNPRNEAVQVIVADPSRAALTIVDQFLNGAMSVDFDGAVTIGSEPPSLSGAFAISKNKVGYSAPTGFGAIQNLVLLDADYTGVTSAAGSVETLLVQQVNSGTVDGNAMEADNAAPAGATATITGISGNCWTNGAVVGASVAGVNGYAAAFNTGVSQVSGVNGQAEADASVSGFAASIWAVAPAGTHATDANVYTLKVDSGGKSLMGGNYIFPNLPTADPHVVGQLWSSAGTLHVSAG